MILGAAGAGRVVRSAFLLRAGARRGAVVRTVTAFPHAFAARCGHSKASPGVSLLAIGRDAFECCYAGTPAGSGLWLAGRAAACQIRAASRTIATANGSMNRTTRTGPADDTC